MKIEVQALASDTVGGTSAHVVLTDEEAVSWLIEEVGQDQSEYELYKEDHPDADVWDFLDLHGDSLDTFSWESVDVAFDLTKLPIPKSDVDKVEEALECLRRARDLIKAASNLQTLKRIRTAISSALGARRIQDYRETRKTHA